MKIPFSIPVFAAKFKLIDLLVFSIILGVISLVAYVASGWRYEMQPAVEIGLKPYNLAIYSANSLLRIFIAYSLSLAFSIWYGYKASKSKLHEKMMIPLLDVLQSIPILSFLPAVTMAMITLFPNRRIGLELASIMLIFTGQVWNMAFSYYNSINTIPKELTEVARIYKHSRFTKFISLDLPYSSIGLVWNSMMSVAGGWFFLMASEMFVLKDRDFRLPGLGSYIQTAASRGDMLHVFYGLGAMVSLIVALDFLIWRPVVVWSQKFRFDTVKSEEETESSVLDLLKKSLIVKYIRNFFSFAISRLEQISARREAQPERKRLHPLRKVFIFVIFIFLVLTLFWSLREAAILLSGLRLEDYKSVLISASFSVMRTTLAIALASLWTIPLGVYIGLNPRAAQVLRPVVQVVASIPATAVFPVILLFLIKLGGGLGVGSVLLMLLGTQWYILFNVIAGASAIPEDLKETANLYGLKGLMKWKLLILPGIFPYLITGLITATGGAWNATIVSEHVTFGGKVIKTAGIGSMISEATVTGNFGSLLLSTAVIAIVVVSINRLLWKRLLILAQDKYRLD